MWPSFGAFGWPCGSTSVKFVTSIAKYRSWEMVGPGFGDTIVIVGVPTAGPWVAMTDGSIDVGIERRPIVLNELQPNRVRTGFERERNGLDSGEQPGIDAVHVQVHMAFGRTTDLTDAARLHEDEVGHREAHDHRGAIANDLIVRRRED